MMDAAGYGHFQAGLFYHPTTGVLLIECMGGPLDYNTFEVPLLNLLADAIKARLKTRGGDLPAPDSDTPGIPIWSATSWPHWRPAVRGLMPQP
jgi:hypothetical protein